MRFIFLDMPPEPSLVEKGNQNNWLIIVALLALAGLVGFFFWRNKRRKTPGK